MLNVFLTINVGLEYARSETTDLTIVDRFQRSIYGPTRSGDCALPLLFDVLEEKGLTGTFFVEPLFSLKFGLEPLQEIVSLISNAGHEIQLQLQPEWLKESQIQLFDDQNLDKTHLREFTIEQQSLLIKVGLDLMQFAGARQIHAFRASHYGLNRDTLKALSTNAVFIDSSYNKAINSGDSGLLSEQILLQPVVLDGVTIYPVTVVTDTGQNLQALQITKSSFKEFESVLFHAVENQWNSVVIVLNSFDLMTPCQERLDSIVLKRFSKLCQLLSERKDLFNVTGFSELETITALQQPEIPVTGRLNRYLRAGEQAIRHII